jgi:putative redox protein
MPQSPFPNSPIRLVWKPRDWNEICTSGFGEKTMEVNVRHLDRVKFEVFARGHRLVCDQPRENGGADEGMSPPEFLLASLATCAGYYAVEYLKARSLSTADLCIRVTAEKDQRPARFASFRIEVTAPGLDEHHQAGLLRAVKACLIHNTLKGIPEIETVINAPVLAPA